MDDTNPHSMQPDTRHPPHTATDLDVLQVSKYYYPEVGGIEQVVQTLAEELHGPEMGVQVLAAAAGGRGGHERINGVPVTKVTSLGELASTPLTPLFPVRLASRGRSVDIVHLHLPNPVAVASYLSFGPSDPRLVVTYHSDIVRQSKALKLYRPMLHRVLGRADRIVTTSPNLLEHSEHLQPHADRCEVIPLSVDLDRFDAYEGPEYDLPTDPDRPTLLFVGRLSYYKGVQHLVDAMGDVDADLLVVGDGDRREDVESRARERGVTDRIHFLGRVDDEMLDFCYREADVFVLPSVAPSEAFGIVQLEAMAVGTPVVNTDLPTGVPWVSRDGETGLTVPPGDARALADAINRLVENPELRRRYGENAAERVHETFGRERMVERTRELYEELS